MINRYLINHSGRNAKGGIFMSKHKWDERNISDQKGRIAVITGSNSGIGFEAARVLAHKNVHVILAVRNMEKGEQAKTNILERHPNAEVSVMNLDLADLTSVKQFAEKFRQQYANLDLLINNAGVMMPPYSKTKDGFELQFGTNHLGHFALTGLLLDLLRETPGSRIVNVSSTAHRRGNLNFDDLNWEKRKYNPISSYGDSKIANLYFTYELDRRLRFDGKNPIVVAAHPGWTTTELQRHIGVFKYLNHLFAQNAVMGALPTLYAAVSEDVVSGDYIGPSGFMEVKGYPKKVGAKALARDQDIARKLWDISEALTGVTFKIAAKKK